MPARPLLTHPRRFECPSSTTSNVPRSAFTLEGASLRTTLRPLLTYPCSLRRPARSLRMPTRPLLTRGRALGKPARPPALLMPARPLLTRALTSKPRLHFVRIDRPTALRTRYDFPRTRPWNPSPHTSNTPAPRFKPMPPTSKPARLLTSNARAPFENLPAHF
ncbi:hypothetical protein K438DRAFT_1979911 [Mycena galopus ATCC 62051]|nr:hypothetical protein K438DRAFT_1979911 [Mycena galopus ATCC 62051]